MYHRFIRPVCNVLHHPRTPSPCFSSLVAITFNSLQYLPYLSFFISSGWPHFTCMAVSGYVTHLTSDYSTPRSLLSVSLFVCNPLTLHWVGRIETSVCDMSHMSHNRCWCLKLRSFDSISMLFLYVFCKPSPVWKTWRGLQSVFFRTIYQESRHDFALSSSADNPFSPRLRSY